MPASEIEILQEQHSCLHIRLGNSVIWSLQAPNVQDLPLHSVVVKEERGNLKSCGEVPAVCTDVFAVWVGLTQTQIISNDSADRNSVNSNIIAILMD